MADHPLQRTNTYTHQGFHTVVDPFAPRRRPGSSFLDAVLSTTIFQCWHIMIFYAAWSSLITVLNVRGVKISFEPTLLTVVGTVLGFVISYRTTSSFERYNEGRRYWSSVIVATRTFARTTWFHVPIPEPSENQTMDEMKARSMVEKKSVINLLEAFAVSLKHYLRGEDSIYYKDLYYLVKFLPAYALPSGIPVGEELRQPQDVEEAERTSSEPLLSPASSTNTVVNDDGDKQEDPSPQCLHTSPADRHVQLPPPVTAPRQMSRPPQTLRSRSQSSSMRGRQRFRPLHLDVQNPQLLAPSEEDHYLMPAYLPPKSHIYDIFPFSLIVRLLTNGGKEMKGKKAARLRARMQDKAISHNLPLEISLYLSSYISSLQQRKVIDVPTTNTLIAALNQLVDSSTGFERILTTPIPFSYSFHLWLVTIIYNLALPLQIWEALGWATIPASIILSFIFFGFLVAGEEIENPFGYDKNDLNMDHFTHNIIRNELRAITSAPPPDPLIWAFTPENNLLFNQISDSSGVERVAPDEWVKRGHVAMQYTLRKES